MTYTVIDTPTAKLPYAANKNVQQLRSLLPVINSIHKELEPFEEDMALYVLRTLYITREFLNNQKGQRKDPTADDYIAVTWNWYCQSLGLCRRTANNWLKNFTPAELSEDGKDHIQLDRVGNGFWRLLSRLYCALERDAFGFLPQASKPAVPAYEIPELHTMNYTVIDSPAAKQPRKSNWRPTRQEGLYIQYQLGLQGITLRAVADKYSVSKAVVSAVTAGQRRSRRIEAEIARILGKESWADVVIEARLAVSDPAYTPSVEAIAAYKSAHSDCEQSGNEEEE